MDQIIALRQDVESLTDEVMALRKAFGRRTMAVTLIVIVFFITLLLAFRIQAENQRQIEANNSRWCPFVSLLTVRPGESQPTTQRGRDIAARAGELARDFNCSKTQGNVHGN